MNLMLMPVLTALALRCIAVLELLARLRWKKHKRRAHLCHVVTLPCSYRLDEIRADDGSGLHLVIVLAAEVTER